MTLRPTAALAGMFALATSFACADEQPAWYEDIRIDGFGTIAWDVSDSPFRYSLDTDRGGTFRENSRAGLHIAVPIGDRLSVEAQLLLEPQRDRLDLTPDWFFVAAEASDEVTVRAGRTRLPILLTSDYINVGYAYPWIRPPGELYGAVGTETIYGSDAIVRFAAGDDADLIVQPFVGVYDEDGTIIDGLDADLDIKHVLGVTLTLQGDSYTLRGSALTGKVHVTYNEPVFLRGLGFRSDFLGLSVGASYDRDDMVVYAEAAVIDYKADDVNTDFAWYVTLGRRFGPWLPHLTFAERHGRDNGPLQPNQQRLSLGVRYDIADGIAVKAEVERVRPHRGQRGQFDLPGREREVNLVRFAVDAVF